ncbi:MAG: hypothetical protein U0556_16130 [Dehalococcoidia bacterium]
MRTRRFPGAWLAAGLLSALTIASLLAGRAGAFGGTAAPMLAATPSTISYQGRLTNGGASVSGTRWFKFAFVDPAGTSSFWSNDGTSVAGGPPTTAVPLNVVDGVFSVLLGDTTLSGMTVALSPTVFSSGERALRIWFAGGAGGPFTVLTPDQRVSSVPYAFVADKALNADLLGGLDASAFQRRIADACPAGQAINKVTAGGGIECATITGTTSSGITGIVAGVGLAGGGVTGTVSLAVNTATIQSRIATGCPTGQAMIGVAGDGTPTCTTFGTVTGVTAGAGLTGGGLSGIVALSLETATIQSRVDGVCGALQIVAINADGRVNCDPYARSIASGSTGFITVESAGVVGEYTSITIGADGLPLIAYRDASNAELKVVRCGNLLCSAGNTTAVIDSAGDVGYDTSITIGADGLPVMSYRTGSPTGGLRFAKCASVDCLALAGGSPVTIDGGVNAQYTAIAVGADGFPVISYYDASAGVQDLKVAKCGNADCTVSSITTVDATNNVGLYSSIAIGFDGLPVISYHDGTGLNLNVVKCGNPTCTAGNIITPVDSTGTVGLYTSIAIGPDGLPVVSHYGSLTNLGLRVSRCGTFSCSANNVTVAVDPVLNVGLYSSVAIGADGLPVIGYYDSVADSLKVAKCGTPGCALGSVITTTVDIGGDVGQYSSITIGTDGLPVVSYQANSAVSGDLKFAHCGTLACTTIGMRRR